MNYRQQLRGFAATASVIFACLPALAGEPRLILQITIDQLNGDMVK